MHVFRFYLWGTPGTICVPWPRTGSCRREFVPLDRSSRTVSGSSHSDRSKTLPITPRGLRASSTSAPPPTIPTAGGRPGMSLEASLGPPPACQRLHRATRIVSPTGGRGDPSVPAGPMFGDRLTIPSYGYGGLRPDPPRRGGVAPRLRVGLGGVLGVEPLQQLARHVDHLPVPVLHGALLGVDQGRPDDPAEVPEGKAVPVRGFL